MRGFLSCTRILTTNQTVLAEQYHNLTGQIVIEKYFNIENNEIQRIILNYKNRTHFFKNETGLRSFSLTQFINTEMSFSAIKIFILPQRLIILIQIFQL